MAETSVPGRPISQAWTSSIAAMAEAPIGEGAERTGCPMDKLYATEEREGDTRANGGEVPGIAREALSVFSREEWTSAKQATMFEAWVVAARKPSDGSGSVLR